MKHWKYALSSLLLSAVLVGSAYSWYQAPSAILERAEKSFVKGDYLLTLKYLEELEEKNEMFSPQIALLQSYALREQGYIGRSTQKILLGLSLFPNLQAIANPDEKRVALELSLGLALNGYSKDLPSDFSEGLRIATLVAPSDSWVALFKMIEHASKNDWEGVHIWMENQKPREFLSDWMEKPFSAVFTKDQETLLLARAYIERGQTVLARELLENLQSSATASEEGSYLMALSYLFDAKQRSDHVAMGYYKLALNLLKPLDLKQPHWKKYLDRVSDFFANEALEQLLRNEEKSAVQPLETPTTDQIAQENFTFFVQALSHWHADDHLRVLARHFIDSLARVEGAELFPKLQRVQHALLERDPRWRPQVEAELLSRLDSALLEGKWNRVQQFWTMSSEPESSFSRNFHSEAAKKIQSRVAQKYSETLLMAAKGQDPAQVEEALESLTHYLSLLQVSHEESEGLKKLHDRLLEQTFSLFSGQTIAIQSAAFIQLLLDHSPEPSYTEELKERLRIKLYERFLLAKAQGDLASMSLVFDISQAVQMQVIEKPTQERLANLIADAHYLLDSERMQEAQQLLIWILKIAPDHPEAIQLLGSSLFGTGRYQEAKELLLKIGSSNLYLQQMLAISYLQTGEPEEAKAIVDQLPFPSISDRLKLEMGLNEADNARWQEAKQWWDAIGAKSEMVAILKMVALYRQELHAETLKHFTSLPASLRTKKEIISIAARAAIAIDDQPMARSLLVDAVDGGTDSLSPSLLSTLSRFTSEQELDLAFTAAQFFESLQGQHEKALSFLEKSSSRTWPVFVAKARSHTALGNLDIARSLLLEVKERYKIELKSAYYSFWQALAQLELKERSYDKVLYLCEEIEAALGPSEGITEIRTKALGALWNFTSARSATLSEASKERFEQLKLDKQLQVLSLLTKEGRYGLFNELSSSIKTSLLSSDLQWKLARISLYPLMANKMAPITPSLHSFAQLDGKEKGLALYYLSKTSITRAQLWSNEHERELQKSLEGLIALGKVSLESKEIEKASLYLEKAISFVELSTSEHFSVLSLAFLLKELPDLVAMQKLAEKFAVRSSDYYKLTIGEKHLVRTVRLLYFSALAERAQALYPTSLSEIELYLDQIEQSDFEKTQSPITHWHRYLIYQLKAQPTKAEKELLSLQAAAPGMINIHYELSLLLLQSRQVALAQSELEKSSYFFPNSAKVAILQAKLALLDRESIDQPEISDQQKEKIAHLISKACELAPYSPYPYFLSAKNSFFDQDYASAHQMLQKALSLRPDLEEGISLLKAVLRKRMKIEGTHIQWQQQLESLDKR